MSAQVALKLEDGDLRLRRVLALADAMLVKKGRPGALPEQDLRDAGLSSLDSVNLMLAVEGEFDLFIPQGEMTPQNFRCAAAIVRLIDRLV